MQRFADHRDLHSSPTRRSSDFVARNGHVDVMKLLLADSRVDPAADNNDAIRSAAANGHIDVVKLLLADKRANPVAVGNAAIKHVARNGHTDVVKLLLAHPRVDP